MHTGFENNCINSKNQDYFELNYNFSTQNRKILSTRALIKQATEISVFAHDAIFTQVEIPFFEQM